MQNLNSIERILDFAIDNEKEAYAFYMDLAGKAGNAQMKEVFEDFANEEKRHREKLESIKAGELNFGKPVSKLEDMKISDYAVEVEPMANLSYQGALVIAMKKEKAAFRLYMDLANAAGDGEFRNLFMNLAQEEAKHKLRFELEYDKEIYREN